MEFALPALTPLTFNTITSGVQLIGGGFLLAGWAVEETTGAAVARIVIRDGSSSAGQYRVPVTLAAGESARDIVPGAGVLFESGLFVDVTSGTVSGTIFVVPVEVVRDDRGLAVVGQRRPGEWVDVTGLS